MSSFRSKTFVLAFLFSPILLNAHSIFFQADNQYISPDTTMEMMVFCGTLAESEISIQPDTIQTLRLFGPGGSQDITIDAFKPYTTQSIPWRIFQRVRGKLGGFDRRRISTLTFGIKDEGS
jgi:hypothetical protein